MTEHGLDTVTKRLAMDRVGGIEFGKMRSQFFDRSSATFHFQHEIACVWHKNVRKYLDYGETQTRMIVETGYIYDYLFRKKRTEALELRSRLEKIGANVIISVYDNYPHINSHFSSSDLYKFYTCLTEIADKYPQVSLLVKSKKPHIFHNHPDIEKILSRLRESGRCLVQTGQFISVVPSALAANIAVGIPASTAVCEAALCGCRFLMFDPGGVHDHILSRPERKVMYRDIRQFKLALETEIEDLGSSKFSNDPGLIAHLDQFRDGCSPQRAAEFINMFLQCKSNGWSKSRAIEFVTKKLDYCEFL